MTTLTASEARKRLYTLVDDVSESHEAVQIVGKRNTAILVAEEDWRAIQETLYLTSIPGVRESIREGLNTPVDECDEEIDWCAGGWSLPSKRREMQKNWPDPV